MESFRTEDGLVTKFIHGDGSETAIKAVPSQSTFMNPHTGEVSTRFSDRRKYSVFVSSSSGCYLRCPMCHLTIKDAVWRRLRSTEVLANIQEALIEEHSVRPGLRERYVKICWMGMGDALADPAMVRDVTNQVLEWIFSEGLASGLDSVDLSTVMPRVSPRWMGEFTSMRSELLKWPRNPNNTAVEQAKLATHSVYAKRPPFRLFYSLHSAIQPTRERMAPGTTPLNEAVSQLSEFQASNPDALLFHQLFVRGLNDTMLEAEAIGNLIARHFPDNELRILRYNSCDRGPWQEWPDIEAAIELLARRLRYLKVQISAGSEVQAACGQFLVAHTRAVVQAKNLCAS